MEDARQKTDTKEASCLYPWHGKEHAFRAVLVNQSGTSLTYPFHGCLGSFLGSLIEAASEGLGQHAFRLCVKMPVKARYQGAETGMHMLELEAECRIRCQDASECDIGEDWLQGAAYGDGTITLTRLEGPQKWQSACMDRLEASVTPLSWA